MKKAVWFILLLSMGVSCLDQPDCFRQNVNLMGISFKKMYDGQADTVAILSISANGFVDSVFYDTILESSVSLPLNYLQNETTFYFSFLERGYPMDIVRNYSLLLNHESKPQFVSEECGQRFVVSGLAVIDNSFDSIRIVSTTPSNVAPQNIVVYRCPRNNVMRFSFRQLYMDTISRGRLEAREIETVTTASKVVYGQGAQSSVLLPLDLSAETTSFDFKFSNGDANTVTFNYVVTPKVILEKCGEQAVISEIVSTTNNFVKLEVTRDTIHDPPITNVETYLCPITNQVTAVFKTLNGNSKVTRSVDLKSVYADYTADAVYTDTTVSSVILPLNPDIATSSTTFTFEFDNGEIRKLQLVYTVVPASFHDGCGEQPVFSDIRIQGTDQDFVQVPVILIDDAKFPIVTNLEIF
jgi:hypothetical protein